MNLDRAIDNHPQDLILSRFHNTPILGVSARVKTSGRHRSGQGSNVMEQCTKWVLQIPM
ncbi:MAG: hypothetical protein L7V86_05530 [Verrucomicrobiales bacterium]|nr:hypothetical protein [Verrucomicrobiales bacterium]